MSEVLSCALVESITGENIERYDRARETGGSGPPKTAEPPDHHRPIRDRLRGMGITVNDRAAAFNELLREILADLVGCNPKFAAERPSTLATYRANYAIRARPVPAQP